jgi:flavorubredoxin
VTAIPAASNGTTCNAFVVRGETGVAVIDTVKVGFVAEFSLTPTTAALKEYRKSPTTDH